MPPDRLWRKNLAEWSAALEPLAETLDPVETEPPLTPAELATLESTLARPLPLSLRRFALEDAAAVKFYWTLPDKYNLPEPLQSLRYGELGLDIREIPTMEEHRQDWTDGVFPNPDDPYDAPWHHALAFHGVANGDMLALDLSTNSDDPPVIYLSHEGEPPICLGRNFADFIHHYTRVGCSGPESWHLEPFLSGNPPRLDSTSAAARQWRTHFGLPL